jgi:hypothetical protein
MACSGQKSSPTSLEGTDEEQEYDALQISANWEQIVEKSQQKQPQSLACRKVAVLALFHTGRIGSQALNDCLADSREVLTSPLAAMIMSDVYIQVGMVNMAQRAAFESMAKETDYKKNGRALRRLTECAIITGQNDLALKYTYLLEELDAHSKWALSMRRIALNPELLCEEPTYEQLKKTYEETTDQFFL